MVKGEMNRAQLFTSLSKKTKVSVPKVEAIYSELVKTKLTSKQSLKTANVTQQVAVIKEKATIKKVQVIKEVPVVVEKIVIKNIVKEVPVEVIKTVQVIKEVPIEVLTEVTKEVKVPVIKIKEVVKKVPVIKEKTIVKKVPVIQKVVDQKAIDKWKAKYEKLELEHKELKTKYAAKPKTIEVIKEVPVEIIKEVEVVKQIDFASLAKMMKGMKQVEVSKTVVGEKTTRGTETVVERREVKPGTRTKVTGKATKVTGKTSSTTTSTVSKLKGSKDDLTKIEGIGPKIQELLNKGGISTFKKLSTAKISTLKEILKNAGPRFTMHDPGSWPEQSSLAAAGKWDKLKKLQDELMGGK